MAKQFICNTVQVRAALLLLAICAHQSSFGQLDALNLESAPVEPSTVRATAGDGLKVSIEAALGLASRRFGSADRTSGRLSVDLNYSKALQPNLRISLSDRIDALSTTETGKSDVIHSLREAYLSWRVGASEDLNFDAGRINTRGGQGYGYSPTDFFREGSLRLITSADPVSNRQNRLGTVMLRAQSVWNAGSATLIWAPGFEKRRVDGGWSADFGATNHVDRLLLSSAVRISEQSNAQFYLFKRGGRPVSLGVNASSLLSDMSTVHIEFTRGREPSILDQIAQRPASTVTGNRLTAGLTYTAGTGTILTAEYFYNGFGATDAVWSALGQGDQLTYLREALRLQELVSRQGALVHVTQKDLGLKGLDVSGYLKFNLGDRSSMLWIEARRRWTTDEVALQSYWANGSRTTEYGLLPESRKLQLLWLHYY